MTELTLADLQARAFIYHASIEPDYAKGRAYLTINRRTFWAPMPVEPEAVAS